MEADEKPTAKGIEKVVVRYARFLSPGVALAEYWTKPVETLDPAEVTWPDNAYAFTLHERTDMVDGEGKTYTGEPRQIGPVYYHPDSKILTEDEVSAKGDPSDSILLWNMHINKWPCVIYTRWGNWPQPYDPNETRLLGVPYDS